jgi:RecB family exonuclease
MTTLRNAHLSYSRLTRFEQCPLSYKLHYLDKKQAEPGVPLRFGKVIHAVLENLVREVVVDERTGPLSEDRAVDLFREAWADDGLAGIGVFEEGLHILREFVREEGAIDHRDVLAVEKEFHLSVGPFTVLGFIDRVNWVDDETVEVVDYKTNRQIFTREEVDSSLQMSLYHIAAQQLWPWAKNVKLVFRMLRHGIRQATTRTPEQLADALTYVETLGAQTETASEFPARLNANCVYCDHRLHCPAYAEALQGRPHLVCEDPRDLEAVAREREQVARLAKILYARKEELDGILKAQLRDRDELVLGGVRYRMFTITSHEYPVDATLAVLADATGMPRDELLGKVAVVEKKSLDALLKELGKRLDKPRVSLLKAELEARAEKRQSPRFWAKEAG